MVEVQIDTKRGLNLAGDFINPVDSRDTAVIMVHDFLANRHGFTELTDRAAAIFRGHGLATLAFDLSGHGGSDDTVITLAEQVEDITDSSRWLVKQGKPLQAIQATGFGAAAALQARPKAAVAQILINAPLVHQSIPWDQVFSEEQLNELERVGHAVIPDDSDHDRSAFIVSKQTLLDLTHFDGEVLLSGLTCPVMLLYDREGIELGHAARAKELRSLLPAGSEILEFTEAHFASETLGGKYDPQALQGSFKVAVMWLEEQLSSARN